MSLYSLEKSHQRGKFKYVWFQLIFAYINALIYGNFTSSHDSDLSVYDATTRIQNVEKLVKYECI